MHISDGVLSGPVSLCCGLIATAGCSYCIRQFRRTAIQSDTPRLGLVAAFIFAAQMVNFPLGFAPVSGHLIGGTLAATLLGPWGGGIAIAAVLIVQSLLMGDGALTAIGANWINMGLIGSVAAAFVLNLFRSVFGNRAGLIIAAMLTAWISVTVSAAAFSLELALSTNFQSFLPILTSMILVHAVIAVGEAIITGLVLRGVISIVSDKSEAVNSDSQTGPRLTGGNLLIGGFMAAVSVVIFLAPLASSFPDGLEYVGNQFGFIQENSSEVYQAPLPDYSVPGMTEGRWSTVAAGLAGMLVVFISSLVLTRGLSSQRVSVLRKA
jgi:cobalt/nickel transport system permease protein